MGRIRYYRASPGARYFLGTDAFKPIGPSWDEYDRQDDGVSAGEIDGARIRRERGTNYRPELDGSHPSGSAEDFAGRTPLPEAQPAAPDCTMASSPQLTALVYGAFNYSDSPTDTVSLKVEVQSIDEEVEVIPPGFEMDFAGDFIPAGWLERNGQLVLILTYPDLYAVLGIKWGGDGVTTFGLPNDIGRVSIGAGNDGDGHVYTVGQYGGANSTLLVTDNLPGYLLDVLDLGHVHGVSDPGHLHGYADLGHVHAVTDPGHVHAVTDPGHMHSIPFSNAGGPSSSMTYTLVTTNRPGLQQTGTSTTGLTVNSHSAGVSIDSAVTGINIDAVTTDVTVNVASTGVQVHSKGLDVPIDRRMPYNVKRKLIKT